MNHFLTGLLGTMLVVGTFSFATQAIGQTNAPADLSTNTPAETDLDQLMADDDAAMDEVDGWIRTNAAEAAKGGGVSRDELNKRINARLDAMRQKYEDYLKRYPDYAPGHLAYGSFLDEIGKEELASVEYATASKLDPKNPAAWNDLANYEGEYGQITNAFINYQKAIDLDPTEPVYYENLATSIYVFRRDAMSFYKFTEPQVFDKSLALYRKAIQLAPNDFALATDYAESYYAIKPLRTDEALGAWTNALNTARTDEEREGVFIHLARIKYLAGRYAEARSQLVTVTNSMYDDLKNRINRNISAKVNPQTNAAPNNLSGTNLPAMSVATNNPSEIATNIMVPNGIPALTNPPSFSTNEASVMTNVPPTSPAHVPLQDTNPPVNPTNLLNNLDLSPPVPRPSSGQ
ncbi:MAG TPA: hypothetical protein VGI03_02735 [Verrucomicrobiae bacterium]